MTIPRVDGLSPLTPIRDLGAHNAFVGTHGGHEVIVLHAIDPGSSPTVDRIKELGEHDHIARVVDHGILDGRSYVVIAAPASPAVVAIGKVGGVDAVQWAVELSSALDAAHDRGIVHEAVSPRTVGIDDLRHAQLFGFALRPGTHHEADSVYTAPEVRDGAYPLPPADVYSLAATLHHFLANEPPNATRPGGSQAARLEDHGVPRPIAAAVRAGLATDPAHRPDARSFAQQLRAALAQLRPVAPPTGSSTAGADVDRALDAAFERLEAGARRQPANPLKATPKLADTESPATPAPLRSTAKLVPAVPVPVEPAETAEPVVPTAGVPSQPRAAIRPMPPEVGTPLEPQLAARRATDPDAASPTAWVPPEPPERLDTLGGPTEEWLAPALWIAAVVLALAAAQIALVSRLLG